MTGQRSLISPSTETALGRQGRGRSDRFFHGESTVFENIHSRERAQPDSPIA